MHILCKSSFGKVLGAGFHTHRWKSSSVTRFNPGKTVWSLRSRIRRHKFIQYLKMKLIWEGLSEIEMRALLDHPGVVEDNLFIAALRAKMIEIPDPILNSRLKAVTEILELPRLDLSLFMTWKKLCVYDLQEIDKPISKPKKYSGYIKSPSAAGSKSRKTKLSDPEIFEWSSVNEIDLLHALTVGDFIGESLVIHLPDDGPIRPKRLKSNKK